MWKSTFEGSFLAGHLVPRRAFRADREKARRPNFEPNHGRERAAREYFGVPNSVVDFHTVRDARVARRAHGALEGDGGAA